MDSALFSAILKLHIACGALALLTFSVPMWTQKGGKTHRRFGWAYVAGMAGVAVTALILSGGRLLFERPLSQTRESFSIFLIMIAVFAASATWSGIRTLKLKAKNDRNTNPIDLGWVVTRIATAAFVSGYGIAHGDTLLTWFPLVAISTGIGELRYWLSRDKPKMHWWFEHTSCMFTACIATVTAFVVTVGPRWMGAYGRSLLLWLSPTIVMVPLLVGMQAYYRRKFAPRPPIKE